MFDVTPQKHGFTLKMSSDLANVDRCVELIGSLLEKKSADRHLFALSLLAREALNNAMIHGNALDREKRVFFSIEEKEGGYDMLVEDEGGGFNWEDHIRTTSKLDDVSGRGHEIYRNFARAVHYNAKGNALRIEYRA